MKEDDPSKANDEKSLKLTVCKPEDQAFQRLHLCEYLSELYESAEEENKSSVEKKKA